MGGRQGGNKCGRAPTNLHVLSIVLAPSVLWLKPYNYVFLICLCTGYMDPWRDASVVVSEGTWQLLHCGLKEHHKTVPLLSCCCAAYLADRLLLGWSVD